MKLDELIDIADEAYGEGLVKAYHEQPDEDPGDGCDTLAEFIAIELGDVA